MSTASDPAPRPVVLTSQYGYEALRREVRAGELERLRRGAFVPPIQPGVDPYRQHEADIVSRCRAIHASLSCRLAFSHGTAAGLRRWQAPTERVAHITQTFRPGPEKSSDIVRHHVPDIADDDIVWLLGVPVTGDERTTIDCALLYPPHLALPIVDAALRSLAGVTRFNQPDSVPRQDLVRAQLLARLEERGSVRHVRRAREVITQSNGLAEFGSESWLRWLVLTQGLPVPQLQVPIATPRGMRYADLMWSAEALSRKTPLIAEYDGLDKYGERPGEVVVEQTDREQQIVDATHATLLRFTKHDRRDPHGAAQRLFRQIPPDLPLTRRPDLLSRPPRPRRTRGS